MFLGCSATTIQIIFDCQYFVIVYCIWSSLPHTVQFFSLCIFVQTCWAPLRSSTLETTIKYSNLHSLKAIRNNRLRSRFNWIEYANKSSRNQAPVSRKSLALCLRSGFLNIHNLCWINIIVSIFRWSIFWTRLYSHMNSKINWFDIICIELPFDIESKMKRACIIRVAFETLVSFTEQTKNKLICVVLQFRQFYSRLLFGSGKKIVNCFKKWIQR